MVAARRFNEAGGRQKAPVRGCVTTGETWQFLRLAEPFALLDRQRSSLNNVGGILGALHAGVREALGAPE